MYHLRVHDNQIIKFDTFYLHLKIIIGALTAGFIE